MPRSRGYKYLLGKVDAYTGWVETFAIQIEKAGVTKNLIKSYVVHLLDATSG